MNDCYLTALRILSYRFNAEGELRRKLRAKKFDAHQIDAAIDCATKSGSMTNDSPPHSSAPECRSTSAALASVAN